MLTFIYLSPKQSDIYWPGTGITFEWGEWKDQGLGYLKILFDIVRYRECRAVLDVQIGRWSEKPITAEHG